MMNYVLYQAVDDPNDFIARVFTAYEDKNAVYEVEKELIDTGYIIYEVDGCYIRCSKIDR